LRAADVAAALGVDGNAVSDTLRDLAEEYRRDRRGFQVVEVAGGFRLVTLPELASVVLAMRPELAPYRLSGAARETLAAIAYRREATRAELENVRGVNCEKLLATLLEHGLIEERGRRDTPGRPIVYATTARFLEHFGLNSLDDLPPLPPPVD
jgi:segregation and condensation protein B